MPCIDFVAITAAYNWEPYLALMPVTATEGDLAAGDTSVGFGPGSTSQRTVLGSPLLLGRPIPMVFLPFLRYSCGLTYANCP